MGLYIGRLKIDVVDWMGDIPILGKKVVISKTDGVRKYGVLKSISQQFLVLETDDGKELYIPIQNVGSISLHEEVVR